MFCQEQQIFPLTSSPKYWRTVWSSWFIFQFERKLEVPKEFKNRKPEPTIGITAEELSGSNEVVHLRLNGRKLAKKDLMGKSDPFVVISKAMDDGTYAQVHKSEVIKNNLNPDWKQFTLRVASLTGGKPDSRKIKFQVYDWDSDASSELIGDFETTYTEMLTGLCRQLLFNQTKLEHTLIFLLIFFKL